MTKYFTIFCFEMFIFLILSRFDLFVTRTEKICYVEPRVTLYLANFKTKHLRNRNLKENITLSSVFLLL
jgi:hypothetical protein